MNQRLIFGRGAVNRVPRALTSLGVQRLFLVTGGRSFESCGAESLLAPLLRPFTVAGRFGGFRQNPQLEDVVRGIDDFRAAGADGVLAVGGGSVLDMAKLVNVLAHQPSDPSDLVLGRARIERRGLPVIAVPTTAGSGSEATHFAVVYVDQTKYSVAHPSLLPAVALVDPSLTYAVPPSLTAVTGMDAFAQAVESYWSIASTTESKGCARQAIGLVLGHLAQAVNSPTPRARRAMSKAAYLAGCAINITKTTGAHAMSYPLTSHFGIPHGHAVSLTLGQWLLFNSQVTDQDVTDPRGAAYVRQTVAELVEMLGCRNADAGCRMIETLAGTIGLQTRLGALGVSRSAAMDVVVPNVNAERLVNNPRALTPGGLRGLVEAVC